MKKECFSLLYLSPSDSSVLFFINCILSFLLFICDWYFMNVTVWWLWFFNGVLGLVDPQFSRKIGCSPHNQTLKCCSTPWTTAFTSTVLTRSKFQASSCCQLPPPKNEKQNKACCRWQSSLNWFKTNILGLSAKNNCNTYQHQNPNRKNEYTKLGSEQKNA